MNILVVGNGVVGNSTGLALQEHRQSVWWHDPPKGINYPEGELDQIDIALLCVPTPLGAQGYNDRNAVYHAAQWLEDAGYAGIVGIRSTCIMGTCDNLAQAYPGMQWFSWPEFLRVANAREWAARPRYTVVGWSHWDDGRNPVTVKLHNLAPEAMRVTPLQAEFVKYASNALLASSVGVANELADLASHYGIDWNQLVPPIAELDANMPKNVKVLDGGGYGGACLPKDVAALLYHAVHDRGVEMPVLQALHKANVARRYERGDYDGISGQPPVVRRCPLE